MTSDTPMLTDHLITMTNIYQNSLGIVSHSNKISSLQSGVGESVTLCGPTAHCSESEIQYEHDLFCQLDIFNMLYRFTIF